MTKNENKRQAHMSVSLSGHTPSESTVSCRSRHGYITPQWERLRKGQLLSRDIQPSIALSREKKQKYPIYGNVCMKKKEDKQTVLRYLLICF